MRRSGWLTVFVKQGGNQFMLEITMVHDVVLNDAGIAPPYACAVTVDTLDSYLQSRQDWTNWGGNELAAWIDEGCPPVKQPTYLVTFDDAYASVQSRALTLLEAHKVKALVFVSTRCAEGWIPLESRLWHLMASVPRLENTPWGPLLLNTPEEKMAAYRRVRTELKPLTPARWEPLLDALQTPTHASVGEYMSWSDLMKLNGHPLIELGSHTHEHIHLPTAGLREIRNQLVRSRQELASHLGRDVRWLSYPYGGTSPVSLLLAWHLGYRGAFLASSGAARSLPACIACYVLPRTDIRNVKIQKSGSA